MKSLVIAFLVAVSLYVTQSRLFGQVPGGAQGVSTQKYYQPELVKEAVPLEPVPSEVRAQFLRPGELLAIQEKFPAVFLPIGTLEWHGRHLPIGCDAIKAERLCLAAAQKVGGVVMPTLYFSADAYRDTGKGYALGMDAPAGFQLPGSFYAIDSALLKEFMLNAARNYLGRGFKLVIIVSGHNPSIQQNLMDEVCYIMKSPEGREPVLFTMEYAVLEEGNPRRRSDHAGGYETSMMLHLNPDRVNMKANDGQKEPRLALGEEFPFENATAEEGRIRFDLQVEGLAKLAREKLGRIL